MKIFPKTFNLVLASFLIICLLFSQVTSVSAASASDNTTAAALQQSLSLDFKPTEALIDPIKPIVYLLDSPNKRLWAYNFVTKETRTLNFDLYPRNLAFDRNRLFIILSNNASPFTPNDSPKSVFTEVDTETLSILNQTEVTQDIYDFTLRDGYAYVVLNESRGQENVHSYSLATGQLVDGNGAYTYIGTLLQVHPTLSKLYTTMNGNVTVRILNSDGSFGAGNNYSEQTLTTNSKISPDGRYLFNSSGIVLDANLNKVTDLKTTFTDIAFNHQTNNFYLARNKSVEAYSYSTSNSLGFKQFDHLTSYTLSGTVQHVFVQGTQLIALTTKDSQQTLLEILPLEDPVVSSPNYPTQPFVPLDFIPKDTLFDPEKPVVYFSDQQNKRIYAVNYAEKRTLSLEFTDLYPEKLALYKDQLYITLNNGDYGSSQPGKVAIVNRDSFTLTKTLDLAFDPYGITLDQVGNLYISSRTLQLPLTIISASTGQATQSTKVFGRKSTLTSSPVSDLIYIFSSDLGLQAFTARLDQGTLSTINYTNSLYWQNFKISPDGERLLVNTGNSEVYDKNLNLQGFLLGVSSKDFAFDGRGKFFVAHRDKKMISVYEDNKLTPDRLKDNPLPELTNIAPFGKPQFLNYQNGQLVSVSQNDNPGFFNNQYFIEVFDVQAPRGESLQIQEMYPLRNQKDLPVNTPIMVKFNHFILPAADFTRVILQAADGSTADLSIESLNDILYLQPKGDLKYNTNYTVKLPGSSVTDFNGAKLEGDYSYSFQTGQEFTRYGGIDRYETSVKISEEWPSSNYAVLATGEDFPDALSAAPLAKKYNAPILLTPQNSLPAQTEAELDRLKVNQVFLIGGYGAISQAIQTQLESKGINCVRIQGTDRYATSLAIAKELGPSQEVFVATGENFPDALSIASYAASHQIPILLTPREQMTEETLAYVADSDIQKAYIIGGIGVISSWVEGRFRSAERISGQDRYATNFAVLAKFPFDFTCAFFATAENFPDALSGSALAGTGNFPIMLISKDADFSVFEDLAYNKDLMKMKYILGAEGAVQNSLLDKIFH